MKKLIMVLLLIVGVLAVRWVLLKAPLDFQNPDYICQNCNVIIISMTNLRFDHMSSSGYFRPTTPYLDRLAASSLNFTNSFSHASWTLPSGLSIFSSLYPFQHGVMNRYDGSKLSKNIPTLVDILNNNGYKTASFTGGADYSPKYGLTDRFSEHAECTKGDPNAYLPPFQYGEFDCTSAKALDWLKQNSSQKFLLFLQGYDAHCPFAKHQLNIYDRDYSGSVDFTNCIWTFDNVEPVNQNGKTYYPVYESKVIKKDKQILIDDQDITHLIALYDEQITATDHLLGNFLEEINKLGLSKNTIIIFTSEHGDIFGKHGRFMRGGPLRGTFYDDILHIPLLVKSPRLKPAKLDSLVGQIDLAPTILDLLNIKSDPHFQGKSLTPLLGAQKVNDYIFAGSQFNPDPNNFYYAKKTRIETARDSKWKLISETIFDANSATESIELYNIKEDPQELHNLSQNNQDIVAKLKDKLNAWSKNLGM